MRGRNTVRSLTALGVALALALLAAVCGAALCPGAAWAADERTGSIVVHEYRTQLGATQPGTGDAGAILPADAEPLADVPLTLYRLSEDPQATNGFDPSVTVDSPPLASFDPRTGSTDAQGALAFGDLPRGVYLLVQGAMPGLQPAQQKLLVAVPMENAAGDEARWDVHVYPKSYAVASIAKQAVDPDTVYGVGDEASWRIVLPVPAELKANGADGAVRYGSALAVRDPLDARLDFVEGAQVALVDEHGAPSATALVAGVDYEEAFDARTRTASWTFTDEALKRIANAGAHDLVITLTTRVNEAAYDAPGAIYNDASASFTSATGEPVQVVVVPGGTPDPENPAHPRIYTGGLRIDKHLDATGEKLSGAVFKVARSYDDARAGRFIARTAGGAAQDIELVTDANGAASLAGLAAGTYWLVETQAPSYADAHGATHACVRLTEPAAVTVPDDPASATVGVSVANRLETPLDQAGSAAWTTLVKTGDAGWLAATALLVALAAGIGAAAYRRSARGRDERTDER